MFSVVGEVSITNSRLLENASRRVEWTLPWYHVRSFDEIKMESPTFIYGNRPLRFQILKTSFMDYIKIYLLVLESPVPSHFVYRVRLDVIAFEEYYYDEGTLLDSTEAELMTSEFATTIDFIYASRISIFGVIAEQSNHVDPRIQSAEETSTGTEEARNEETFISRSTEAASDASEDVTGRSQSERDEEAGSDEEDGGVEAGSDEEDG